LILLGCSLTKRETLEPFGDTIPACRVQDDSDFRLAGCGPRTEKKKEK
jgi:hypothetical protein